MQPEMLYSDCYTVCNSHGTFKSKVDKSIVLIIYAGERCREKTDKIVVINLKTNELISYTSKEFKKLKFWPCSISGRFI